MLLDLPSFLKLTLQADTRYIFHLNILKNSFQSVPCEKNLITISGMTLLKIRSVYRQYFYSIYVNRTLNVLCILASDLVAKQNSKFESFYYYLFLILVRFFIIPSWCENNNLTFTKNSIWRNVNLVKKFCKVSGLKLKNSIPKY